jgi:hypothetical protein
MRSPFLTSVLISTLMACGVDAPDPATPDTELTSTEVEPSGAQCAAGGVAVHTGLDQNQNGILDREEIESTTYACSHVTLVRENAIGSGPLCPGGGVLVHSGHDVNNNGSLEDTEIEATSAVCQSDEIYRGDLRTSDFASHMSRERLSRVRVVTGNVVIDNNAPLTSLEMVGGSVELRTDSLIELPTLDRIVGNLIGPPPVLINSQPASRGVQLRAPKLATIGGDASLTSWTDAGIFSAPSLTAVDGQFILGGKITTLELDSLSRVGGTLQFDVQVPALSLPVLAQVGGRVRVSGWFTELDMKALQTAGAFELIYSSITSLRLPLLKSASTILIRRSPMTSVEMPRVAGVTAMWIDGLPNLTTFDLPLVTELDSLYVARMWSDDLALFGNLRAIKALTIEKSRFTSLNGLDQLAKLDSLTVQNNARLASLDGLDQIEALAGDLTIKNNPALVSLEGLGALTNVAGSITITDNAALPQSEVDAFHHRLSR